MNRQERRDRTERKWISRLKKYWNSNVFFQRIHPVKSNQKRGDKYEDLPEAETFDDFKQDKFGVMLKNTGTLLKDNKRLDAQEEHKRNVSNRTIPKEDQKEIDSYIEDMNDRFSFEKYCGSCDKFETEECPYKGKVLDDTKYSIFGCTEYIN